MFFENQIKENFSNQEIFQIFQGNKRTLLILIEEQILIINESIVKTILEKEYILAYYPQYFFPEIKPYLDKEMINEFIGEGPDIMKSENTIIHKITKEQFENFDEKRKLAKMISIFVN